MFDKIGLVQIEPNSVCNLRCWYCPHGWERRPVTGSMTIEQIHGIIDQCTPKSRVFTPTYNFLTTTEYNESLMYPHYEEVLELMAEHGLTTYLLTNGTTINDAAAEYLARHIIKGTINRSYFNIPSGDRNRWKRYTGGTDVMFDGMVDGMKLLLGKLPKEFLKKCSIHFNAADLRVDHATRLGPNSRNPNTQEFEEDKVSLQKFGIEIMRCGLLDRAGLLSEMGVLENKSLWPTPRKRVVGCRETQLFFRVDPTGDVILCCHDYRKRYVFGNVFQNSIEEIWEGKRRQDVIRQARSEICRTCCGARVIPVTSGEKVFVEIGTGREDTLLYLAQEGWKGVVVEPSPSNMETLPKYPNVQYVQKAIAPKEGYETFYFFNPKAIEGGKIPDWGHGCGTLDGRFPLRQKAFGEHIQTITVQTITVATLLRICDINRVDFLKIDAETYDAKILADWPFDRFMPETILYEHQHLSEEDQRKTVGMLRSHGYKTSNEGDNTRANRDNTCIGGKPCP